MSDNRLLFVPTDPDWQPTRNAAERAVAYLTSIAPDPDEINSEFSDNMMFHCGLGNWSGVCCPLCKADLEDWLFKRLNVIYQGRASISGKDLVQTTPCCASQLSLNNLDYKWPAAFGRFSLAALNPGLLTTNEQNNEIAARLGHPVRMIWEHI